MPDNSIKENQGEQFMGKGDLWKIGGVPVDIRRIKRLVL